MANVYSKFLSLLPKQVQVIAQVVSVSTDGTIRVALPGTASEIYVRGDGGDTYVEDDYVFIKDGAIIGKTPPLQTVIEQSVI